MSRRGWERIHYLRGPLYRVAVDLLLVRLRVLQVLEVEEDVLVLARVRVGEAPEEDTAATNANHISDTLCKGSARGGLTLARSARGAEAPR